MNSLQKQAWLTIIMAFLTGASYLVAMPFLGPIRGFAVLGVFGLTGFGPLFYRRCQLDERDKTIARRAALAGAMASYGVFIAGCMGTWGFVFQWRHAEQISIHVLGNITFIGIFAFFVANAIAVLIGYHRPMEAGHA